MASPQTIQPATTDATLREQYPDDVFKTLVYLYIGKPTVAGRWRGIVTFDFSSLAIPAGSTITSAVLSMYLYDHNAVSEGNTIRVSHLLRYDYVDAQVCWSHYKGTTHWTTDGCSSDGNDYTSTDAATYVQPNPITNNVWNTWNITAQVQHCLDSHANVWKGLVSNDNQDTVETNCNYHSSDYTIDASLCPKLYIAWTEPAILTPMKVW